MNEKYNSQIERNGKFSISIYGPINLGLKMERRRARMGLSKTAFVCKALAFYLQHLEESDAPNERSQPSESDN